MLTSDAFGREEDAIGTGAEVRVSWGAGRAAEPHKASQQDYLLEARGPSCGVTVSHHWGFLNWTA